ncbi:DUF4159 domain-containing protein [Hyphomicrobium sp.]|uniref:DUF4159 domain-containing protein n=1 Tax=Hyphomicrobium sp. TaxID=82 RepID=UPI002E35D8FA|nr:DUF4159 domain-containing protein [Hyphomicrobium sp.]HEX2842911.1 DUF4159 domain-containing protein [Hyphomicrobium sp.]
MSLGALAFLNPWLLAGLATLPLIYWLLKTVPPRPKQVEFPATRILVGLENEEKTPAKTPWWLLLIRLLAAALVIFALAEPVLNPVRDRALTGTGPVVIVIDNGWSAASGWTRRTALAEHVLSEAQRQNRPAMIVDTAPATKSRTLKLETPGEARATLAALQPQPFAPDRKDTLATLMSSLSSMNSGAPNILWLADGIDHQHDATTFAEGLQKAAGQGTFAVVDETGGEEPLGLTAGVGVNGKLVATVLRTGGPARSGRIDAFSARSQRLGEVSFTLSSGATRTEVAFDLPLELRNQVTRLELASDHSAGAVSLLDGRSQWQRVGMISGESQEQSQPLLAPLYYLEKAVQPYAEIIRPKDHNLAQGIDNVLKQKASVLMLADIGTLSGDVKEQMKAWVESGGVLVRFAGPRLESGGDDLLPVALRMGGRTLGGALSWSNPQPLADFDDASLFTGIPVPKDVTVSRQVLADPAQLTPAVKVWARLGDGTPLVTASTLGNGQIVLFHVTANSDWSNLPISGLFVEMLRRITALGSLAPAGGTEVTAADKAIAGDQSAAQDAFAPVQTLDGFGILRPPPPTAEAIPANKFATVQAGLTHPPGYYGAQGSPRAINVLDAKSTLAPLPRLTGASRMLYESQPSTPLGPALLTAALALVFADILAVLALLGVLGALTSWIKPRQRGVTAGALLLAAIAASVLAPGNARAQSPQDDISQVPGGMTAQKATDNVTLGYVLTGDTSADATSRAGLEGLSRILAVRTAVEPGEPIAVDIVKDEISFFPVLYWPILDTAEALPPPALAKIDAYMKQGGMIIFDTRDYGTGLPTGSTLEGKNGMALKRVLGSLDVPRLEPVPEDHVLTKSFYLLRSFPGRWEGGQLWVEASAEGEGESRKARRADGVTSIMITSNDFASAWALDKTGRPLYPVVPGGESQREMALRTGINIVMHALTGNYKADQVHVPALLERLGQ